MICELLPVVAFATLTAAFVQPLHDGAAAPAGVVPVHTALAGIVVPVSVTLMEARSVQSVRSAQFMATLVLLRST